MRTHRTLLTHLETLPLWAQRQIICLQLELANVQEELKARQSNKPTEVYIADPLNRCPTIEKEYVQSDRVYFTLPDGEIQVSLTNIGYGKSLRKGLKLMASGVKSCLGINPHVANVVTVELRD